MTRAVWTAVLVSVGILSPQATAAPGISCDITKVTYQAAGGQQYTANAVYNEDTDTWGISIPSWATNVKVWGTYGLYNTRLTTVQGEIAEWNGTSAIPNTTATLSITKEKNGSLYTGKWHAPISVTPGKAYHINAKTTYQGQTVNSTPVILNVSN